MYILAQSWQPTFCFGKEAQYPGCRAPQRYWQSHLTLHGLWPELTGSAPPSFCAGEAFDVDKIERELGLDTLHQFWPDVKFSEASPQYPDFWKHEWTRHGTCSGLEQVAYFTHALNLERNETLAPTPRFVQEHVGAKVDATKLRQAFGDAALKCQRAKHVTMFSQVFTCWLKDEHNVPTRRTACPSHIHAEDTCGHGSLTIPTFPRDIPLGVAPSTLQSLKTNLPDFKHAFLAKYNKHPSFAPPLTHGGSHKGDMERRQNRIGRCDRDGRNTAMLRRVGCATRDIIQDRELGQFVDAAWAQAR
ncbi:hypothetical protein PsorP6_011022 [Peronosclerospora sorghi]|uniref:Uncharacterized protein n=1 Tax=Peronosclerospora sorghi TaxID=230839 RepID=A0ACC0VYM3_9STRA|nr:hypothetical protein PsorP6_011022 [Peronosclerospora sorghi]